MCYNKVMDEARKRRKYRALKVAVTEFFMVLTVVALVFVLTFIVLGYKIGEDGELEQDGFLQIRTSPVGATVTIDGDQIFAKTNLSRAVSAGEHEIVFSKDGYDTWKKNIFITSGLTYRLNYPRLFLLERTQEKVAKFDELDAVSVSPNSNFMLATSNKNRKWQLIHLDEEKPVIKNLDFIEVFPDFAEEGFGGIRVVEWNEDSNKVLVVAEWGSKKEWILIDVTDLKHSKNLTSEFGMQFSSVRMESRSGEQLLVIENGNLRKLNTATAELSRILLSKVESFDDFNSEIAYVGVDDDGERYFGLYQDGDIKGKNIGLVDGAVKVKVVISEYYGDKYFTFVNDKNVKIYLGDFGKKQAKNVLLIDEALDFVPSEVSVRGEGELIVLKDDKNYAVYDIETNKLTKYELENENIAWINDYMFSFVNDGELVIEDFDKENRRKIADNVAEGFSAPIVNDRWIYYIDFKYNLVREQIVD